ncbi:MAG TPA: arginine--tRNA ligase [Bacillota bacterium]|nr:arginine--tRNA ligase [Bacillota bacterium]
MAVLAETRHRIRDALVAAWQAAVAAGALPAVELPGFTVQQPREAGHGDLASNLALALAGPSRLPPRKVAAALASRLGDLGRVDVAGPGFLNVTLPSGWLTPVLPEVAAAGGKYAHTDMGGGRRVLVEFVSANPTGPLNVVNCRQAAYGDALVRCLKAAGWRAEGEYYVNDAGGQFRRLGESLRARVMELRGGSFEVPEGGYPGEYLIPLAEAFDQAEHGDPPVEVYARFAVDRILETQRQTLGRFGVVFDRFVHESAIRERGEPERVVAALAAAGHTFQKDGALWLRSTAFGDNDDRVLVKRNGEFTYRVPDIAYHADKFARGYDVLIDVLGQDHHGDVASVRAGLAGLGYPVERLDVVLNQLVRLVRGGETVRMSKRGGTFISMDEFLDEVGPDAARFFFLMRTVDNHMDFDIDLATRQAADNPVYYVQYAHARICSLVRQAAEAGLHVAAPADVDVSVLTHPAEVALMLAMAELPDEVGAAAEARAPHRVTTYARSLAESFHNFYVQCRVIGEAAPVARARLLLADCARAVLAETLGLLGVGAPERM